jgi:hypothetical protein
MVCAGLLVFCVFLLWWMPSDFAGPIVGVIIILLLIPGLLVIAHIASFISAIFRRRRAMNPNLSPDELKKLAKISDEVLQNPVLPLFVLEDPNYYDELLAVIAAHPRPEPDPELELRRAANDSLRGLLVLPVLMLLLLILFWFLRGSRKPGLPLYVPPVFHAWEKGRDKADTMMSTTPSMLSLPDGKIPIR